MYVDFVQLLLSSETRAPFHVPRATQLTCKEKDHTRTRCPHPQRTTHIYLICAGYVSSTSCDVRYVSPGTIVS